MSIVKVITVNVRFNELDELNEELQKTQKNVEGVENASKEVTKEVSKLGTSSKIISKLDSLTGGWASSIVDVGTGIKDVVKGLNLSRAALIATGIGAFVVILASVVAYWDDIQQYVTGVNVELEEQRQLSDAINLSLERRNQLEKDNARYVDINTQESLLRAKILGASQAEQTEIIRNGLVERLRLAEEYAKKSDELLQKSVGADEETYLKAQERQLKAYDDLAKARSSLGLFDLQQQIPDNTNGGTAKKEKVSKVNPLTGEDVDAETERLSNHFRTLFDLDKWNKDQLQQSADESNARLLTSEEYAQARRLQLEEENKNARLRLSEEEFNAKMVLFDGIASGTQSLGNIIGQETATGKGLAIAGALINTYASIAGQLKAFSGVPIPGFAIAQAAATALSGFAAVKQIANVKIPGQGGSSGVSSSGVASTPPAFNVVQSNSENQLNRALLDQNKEPIQAFVVEKGITSAQELSRNKIQSSSL
ncbi:MAG: hypothetical protein ABJL43_01395 [Maribacter dokdonensis]|uniref:hypothetical protein n=1 Tax=Maribacter dokdonensis TaxID=320912 RepID=UPI003296E8CE